MGGIVNGGYGDACFHPVCLGKAKILKTLPLGDLRRGTLCGVNDWLNAMMGPTHSTIGARYAMIPTSESINQLKPTASMLFDDPCHSSLMHQRLPKSLVLATLITFLGLAGCQDSQIAPSNEARAPAASTTNTPVESTSQPNLGSSLREASPAEDLPAHKPLKETLGNIEGFSSAADQVLYALGKCYSQIAASAETHLPSAVAEKIQVSQLRPSRLEVPFEDEQLVVRRVEMESSQKAQSAFVGPSGLKQALQQLAEPLTSSSDVRVKFKTFRVNSRPDSVATNVYFHATGSSSQGIVEQSATWRCVWTVSPGTVQPTLQSIEVLDYEEVTSRAGPLFEEVTEAVLMPSGVFEDQLLPSIPSWRSRFQMEMAMDMRGHQGIAVGDVNGDGLEDVYLCQPIGLPNRLLLQNADGTVRDASAAAGVDWLDSSRSALILDLDNDGDQDLIVSFRDEIVIAENTGQGEFQIADRLDGPLEPRSLAAIDFDGDRLLDVYACAFWGFSYHDTGILRTIAQVPTPYHDAKNGPPNQLFQNVGGLKFQDITDQCGLGDNNDRFSHAAAWEDFDRDGDPDLYVANDYGRNNLYRCDGGQFTDVAAEYGVEDMAASMSVSWADADNDGWSDLYISNMFSSAGSRITHQAQFQPRLSEEDRASYRRHARGNTLFHGKADDTFLDSTLEAHVEMGRWAWCSQFIDVNNDRWEDLFVANGFTTNEDTGDL